MSMVFNFAAITKEQINYFISHPEELSEFLLQNEDNTDNEQNYLYIDKAWHGIHFLLTHDAWSGEPPQSLVIIGGKEIGYDMGYGPALYLSSEQVKQIAEYLLKISVEQLKQSFDPLTFEQAQIYPQGIWIQEKEEALEYLLGNFKEVVEFYNNAALRENAVIKYIC